MGKTFLSAGKLMDVAPPSPVNTSSEGFWILLVALIIVLAISFIFCMIQLKKAKEKKKMMEEQQNKEKETTDGPVQ